MPLNGLDVMAGKVKSESYIRSSINSWFSLVDKVKIKRLYGAEVLAAINLR